MTSPLDAHQQNLLTYSQGVETRDLRVGTILPGSNEFLTQADIAFIVAHRAAAQAKPTPTPVSSPTQALADDPPPDDTNGPYGPDAASGNTGNVPTAGALYLPSVGAAVLNKQRFQYLLTNAREQDAPFQVGTAPLGFAFALDQAECDWLNEHFGVTS